MLDQKVSFCSGALKGVAAMALLATAAFAQYSISVNGGHFREFVEAGDSAEIRVTTPDARSAGQISVRLNGSEVTGLRADGAAARVVMLTGLKSGPNQVQVFASKNAKSPAAQLTVSTAVAPSMSCADVRNAKLAGLDPADQVTIESATAVPASQNLPAHCDVRGSANPHEGANHSHFAIGFEVRLPDHWSGRFLFQGGGGNDGILNNVFGNNTGAPGSPSALAHGFAVAATDGGHNGRTAASFGFDQQARIDHAYNAYDKTTQIAKALIRAYYGKLPDKSYVIGCSGGGRHAMMFTQRFPEYYDGAVACAPAMRVSSGATISAAWESQLYNKISPSAPDGGRVISQAFSNEDLNLVSSAILKSCDALDGAADGAVDNYQRCKFDPKMLECPGAKNAGCLTSAQVSALSSGFAGPHNSAGKALYSGWAWDPGIAAPGWRQWKLGTSPTAAANSAFVSLMQDALGNEFITPAAPGFSIFDFNFDRDPARMEAESMLYDTYRDDKLAAFHQHGGKLLFFHGLADPIFSALDTIDYYNRLAKNNGGIAALENWSRAFFIPGMTHCAGGPATDVFDGLATIIDWVENGEAPERVLASGKSFPGRTRPLCAYPKQAHYLGKGSIEDAAHFVCQ